MADAVERRAWPRLAALDGLGMAQGRLRPGRPAQILNVSPGGALIETEHRLLPGMQIELQLGEPLPLYRVRGRVLRCHVALLDRERIRYRGALVFDRQISFEREEQTHGVAGAREHRGTAREHRE